MFMTGRIAARTTLSLCKPTGFLQSFSAPFRSFTSSSRNVGLQFRQSGIRLNASAAKTTSELTWNDFLSLRIRRRRVNVICSVFTAFTGVAAGWGFISNIEIDPTQLILGFDPIMVYSLGLVAFGIVGYLAGPSVGNIVFRSMISKQYASFAAKNTEFLRHVRINRPDASKQSYVNPVVDYYGEKIGSLKDYRRWLRDARVYRKKTEKFL